MVRPTLCALGAAACIAAVTVSAQRARPEAAMADAARAYLASLEPAQRQKAAYPFSSEERLNWHFIPKARNGLPQWSQTQAACQGHHAGPRKRQMECRQPPHRQVQRQHP